MVLIHIEVFSLDHPMSTANEEKLPGEPASLFRCQKHNDICHVFRQPNTSQRDLGDQSLLQF
jgi:hypothetical protein